MPISGAWSSRVAEVATSTTLSGTYTDLEAVKNPNLSGTQKTTDITSNDSAGWEESLPTLKNATLKFTLVANEGATQQEAVWTAWQNSTQLYWRLRPRGNVSGGKQVRWCGTVTNIEEDLSIEGAAMYSVTVLMTGAPTIDYQS